MQDETPKDWREPVNEALWRHHLLLGLPPIAMLHWLVWMIVAALMRSFTPFIFAAANHGVFFWLTLVDPEWPKVVSAFLSGPEELDW
jgi:hypothetical protein